MRLLFCAMLTLCSSALPTLAAEPHKVREAIRLPALEIRAGIGYSPANGQFAAVDESLPPAELAESLQRQMKGDTGDAARYRTLGAVYRTLQQPEKARQALSQAAELYERALRKEPDNAEFLAAKGELMAARNEREGAERFLREQTQRHPGEWRLWSTLGRVLHQGALEALWPAAGGQNAGKTLAGLAQRDPAFTSGIAATLRKRFPSPAELERVEKALHEASSALDRGVKEGAAFPEAYAERLGFRFLMPVAVSVVSGLRKLDKDPSQQEIEGVLNEAAGASQAALLEPQLLDDCVKVAELRRDDPRAWTVAGGMARTVCSFLGELLKQELPKTVLDPFRARVAAGEATLSKAKSELQQLAEAKASPKAAQAWEGLGALAFMTGDTPMAVAHLRKSLQIDPGRSQTWEMLTGLLLQSEKVTDAAALLEEQVKKRDSPRVRLILAKVYAELQQVDRVGTNLEAALRQNPLDAAPNLFLAAWSLKQDEKRGLQVAERHLAIAAKALKASPSEADDKNLRYVRAALQAVKGDTAGARKLLEEVLQEDAGHPAARALAIALQ